MTGPFNPTGPGDTPSRRAIFTCRPAIIADETACARKILLPLARRAYRGDMGAADLPVLLDFFARGREQAGTFDEGIDMALRRILASPKLPRVERDPEDVAPGAVYRLTDLELASRLSFFLWSSIPDDELLDAGGAGQAQGSRRCSSSRCGGCSPIRSGGRAR